MDMTSQSLFFIPHELWISLLSRFFLYSAWIVVITSMLLFFILHELSKSQVWSFPLFCVNSGYHQSALFLFLACIMDITNPFLFFSAYFCDIPSTVWMYPSCFFSLFYRCGYTNHSSLPVFIYSLSSFVKGGGNIERRRITLLDPSLEMFIR